MKSPRFERICRDSSIALMLALPWLVPYGPSRNVDAQGLLLIIAGGLAWLSIFLSDKKYLGLNRTSAWLVGVYIVTSVASSIINPHLSYDLLGAPYIRLGLAGFLACIGCGLLLRDYSSEKLIKYLYLEVSAIAYVSLAYTLIKYHSLWRIGGIFNQADFFACFLGCGLLLGLHFIFIKPIDRRWILIINEVFLAWLLVLTQTRAVLGLVILIILLWSVRQLGGAIRKKDMLILVLTLIALVGISRLLPSRLTNVPYASKSVSYRLALQKDALLDTSHKPILGYGPGNLADALDCRKLHGAELHKTCQQGFFFNSSHNIFIDRVLAVGWLGGVAFFGLVVLSIYKGLSIGKADILICLIMLIAGYYFTNVTTVSIELLLWILILRQKFDKA